MHTKYVNNVSVRFNFGANTIDQADGNNVLVYLIVLYNA